MLKPLSQFFCDGCGRVIKSPGKGVVGFHLDSEGLVVDSFILHSMDECVPGQDSDYEFQARPLRDFLGPVGIQNLVSLVEPALGSTDGEVLLSVESLRAWALLARRLQVPYYEEARRYFEDARKDDFFASIVSEGLYGPETLLAIVMAYRK